MNPRGEALPPPDIAVVTFHELPLDGVLRSLATPSSGRWLGTFAVTLSRWEHSCDRRTPAKPRPAPAAPRCYAAAPLARGLCYALPLCMRAHRAAQNATHRDATPQAPSLCPDPTGLL